MAAPLLRPFEKEHAPAVSRLLQEALYLEQVTPELVEEKIWRDGDYDPELNWGVFEDNRLTAMISGVFRNSSQTAFIKILAVAETRRGRGLATALLKHLEDLFEKRDYGCIKPAESAPNYWWPGIDFRYTEALLFFEKRGYRRIGETHNMAVDLTHADWSGFAVPQGIEVRRATMADWRNLTNFLREIWPDWQAEAGNCFANQPISMHLAIRDQRVVGFAAYDANNQGTGWFGPMGVHPAERRRGTGAVLLARCLHDFRQQGRHNATIPWVGPLSFYCRHAGARIERTFARYEKNLAGK